MSSIVKLQGQESNISGQLCESAILEAFKIRGVHIVWHKTRGDHQDLLRDRLLIRNYPYRNLYGGTSRSEFVYAHGIDLRVRIECKSQEEPGSVDQKFPYMFWDARDCVPEANMWFVLNGAGARANATSWFRRQCDEVTSKNIRVLNVSEAQRAIKLLVEKGVA